MKERILDYDLTHPDDAAYWAAAKVLAIKARDQDRVVLADEHLSRLGYQLRTIRPSKRAQGVPDARH